MKLIVCYALATLLAVLVIVISVEGRDVLAAVLGGLFLGVSVTGLVVLARLTR